jgi:aryl sulfotransferase
VYESRTSSLSKPWPSAQVVYDWMSDSRRWDLYRPRPGDVIIATSPKCGTTWMQQILALLVFQSVGPHPLMWLSPWIESRKVPSDLTIKLIQGQTHRRFLKTHLPLTELPYYEEVSYIHVARDGRDAATSYHNHCLRLTESALAELDAIGLQDASIRRPFPRARTDFRGFFQDWLSRPDLSNGSSAKMFFRIERSFWQQRHRSNLLLVHYNDLRSDLDAEMRRVAAFLDIATPPALWPDLVEAARFDAMRRSGAEILPGLDATFKDGHEGFLFSGSNGRWRDTLEPDDLQAYDKCVVAEAANDLAAWLEHGSKAGS